MVDKETRHILVKNDSDAAVKRLGEVVESQFDGCYHITNGQDDIAELATRRPKQEHQESWIKSTFKKFVAAGAAAALLTSGSSEQQSTTNVSMLGQQAHMMRNAAFVHPQPPAIEITSTAKDTVLPNGVTTYGNVPELAKVVDDFPSLWTEVGFANVPEAEWMRIPLRSDWEDKAPKTARVYPMGSDSKKVIDETFDKLHEQGRME